MAPLMTRRSRLDAEMAMAVEAEKKTLKERWREACEGAGLVQSISTVAGEGIKAPSVRDVVLGPPTVMVVELLPGQLPSDLIEVGHRIAPALGAMKLRVHPLHDLRVRVELLTSDPLDIECKVPDKVLLSGRDGVFCGLDEYGIPVYRSWEAAPHAVVQGVTGSGKSWWLYSVLAQLAGPRDVLVCGCDPSGLLWRPFNGSRHSKYQVSGLRNPVAHVTMLQLLVDEMDRRIESLPPRADSVDIDEATPLLVVILEEYPGLLRAVDQHDSKLGKQLRALVSRLLAEGRKAGIRVMLVTQRAEANVIGGFERAMCSLRISFRTDNRDAVKLLHPGLVAEECDDHMSAAPGIALMTGPSVPLARFRGPWIGSYGAFVDLVTARLEAA